MFKTRFVDTVDPPHSSDTTAVLLDPELAFSLLDDIVVSSLTAK